MTREDAKQWIHRKFNQGEAERLMADLIIKALEQEPSEDDVIITYDTYHDLIADRAEKLEQEPCDDAISRQDALDCLTANGLKKFDFILDARYKIKNLPPVNPQKPVLDEMFENIKTEIDFIPTYGAKYADGSINVHVNKKDVLQIIDKYKAESEVNNG